MISASLLVRRRRTAGTQGSLVHRKPKGSSVSVGRGRTQDSSIRALGYEPSSARIRQISDIGESGYSGALERRDTMAGAPHAIPVNVFSNSGGAA